MQAVPRIILTTGEPAGIGPDLLVDIASHSFPAQLVCLTDPDLLAGRAAKLNRKLELVEFDAAQPRVPHQPGKMPYILYMEWNGLSRGTKACVF